jgi:Leucine-rich repeat (LRR) protein
LSKLEYLNLYGTNISDSSLQSLTALPQLKKLYVWETKVDSVGVASATSQRKSLDVVYRLEP